MVAHRHHQLSLCPGCGHPRDRAWHPDNDGWFEDVADHVCNACTARAKASRDDSDDEVTFHAIADVRDYTARPLPPFPQVGARQRRPRTLSEPANADRSLDKTEEGRR